MKLKKLIGKDVAIHCETEQESVEINELIEKLGGRNLHRYYEKFENYTCYDLNDIFIGMNFYSHKDDYEKTFYEIIKAKEILNKNHMKHVFKSGLIVEGTREEIKLIAKALGESIYPVYKSSSKGDVYVDEMNDIHLRNAILLHLREYFTQKNFKNMDNESFLDNLEIQNFPETLEMLIKELNRRVNERN